MYALEDYVQWVERKETCTYLKQNRASKIKNFLFQIYIYILIVENFLTKRRNFIS